MAPNLILLSLRRQCAVASYLTSVVPTPTPPRQGLHTYRWVKKHAETDGPDGWP
jgi:hypothetical protein